jgi:cell wall-associated NlpC family hydrolase
MSQLLAGLPVDLWATRYVGARFPGSPEVTERPGLADGANCQLFAYEVLRLFGLDPPDLRSSELWADRTCTKEVTVAQPLDLALFNADDNPWGAHVGVYIGDAQVLHLSAEVGFPAVWRVSDFALRERYRTLIGFKRLSEKRHSAGRRPAIRIM